MFPDKCLGFRLELVNVKPSWKSCSGKTNIHIIFFGDTVSQGTFEHIYGVGPIKKFRGGKELLEIIKLKVLNLLW